MDGWKMKFPIRFWPILSGFLLVSQRLNSSEVSLQKINLDFRTPLPQMFEGKQIKILHISVSFKSIGSTRKERRLLISQVIPFLS